MKPIDQDKFGSRHGNCYAACIASIFEIPLSYLPAVPDDEELVKQKYSNPSNEQYWKLQNYYDAWWHDMYDKWFADNNLLKFVIQYSKFDRYSRPKGYAILIGSSPRKDDTGKHLTHAVVSHNGLLVHDPHPSHAGLLSMDDFDLILPADPARPILEGIRNV